MLFQEPCILQEIALNTTIPVRASRSRERKLDESRVSHQSTIDLQNVSKTDSNSAEFSDERFRSKYHKLMSEMRSYKHSILPILEEETTAAE